jgi:hypothetical protein
MSDELTQLDFILADEVGGRPLTLETVDLPTLRGFLEEVEMLIKGDVAAASLADSRVRIESGSLRVVAMVAHLLATDLQENLAMLEKTGDLDTIQPKRAQIIERWQLRTRRSPRRSYSIGASELGRPVVISNTTQFQHGSEQAWVAVEKYLTGKVWDLGGKQDPNVHVFVKDSEESVTIGATEQQLADEKGNQLYKEVTLRVQGEQHLRTKALRNLRLIQFVPLSTEVDEQALAFLWEKGRKAWKEVDSATGWVESLRGNTVTP